MQKDILLKIFKSIVITTSISTIVAYGLSMIVGNFIGWFLLTFVLQFIVFYFIGEFVKYKNNKKLIEVNLKQQEIMSRQYLNVTCPCDRKIESTVSINLNKDNYYNCSGCRKDIKVLVDFKTLLATKPIDINPIETPEMINKVKLISEKNYAI